jgi:demethylmenaquinone methyltransferase/2-methoxy-6-polyprenyl-1,4-benzoquinol methylase
MTNPETVSFGYEDIAPAEKAARVGAVFSSVAKSYDRMNDAMSVGMHRLWKDTFVRRVKPRARETILDMAGGTGDIAMRNAMSPTSTRTCSTLGSIARRSAE